MKNCDACGTLTSNPKFCSRSCSARVNGKLYPKRSLEGKCRKCDKSIRSSRKYCKQCRPGLTFLDPEIPIKTLFVKNNKTASKFVKIRNHAKQLIRNRKQKCSHCGWDKHVECCHIKSISDFSEDTPIRTVNHPDNLILLCPNCHWVFDHKV